MQSVASGSTPSPPSLRHRRFSIATLLFIIAATAIALAALCRPSWLAANAIFSLLLASLAVAWIVMCHSKAGKRAFWAGYLAFGSLYAFLSMAHWIDERIGHHLITTTLIDLAYPLIPPMAKPSNNSEPSWEQWTSTPNDEGVFHKRMHIYVKTTDTFLVIGHSIFALLAATAGGFLAGHYHRRET
jgi:hypothetical protein